MLQPDVQAEAFTFIIILLLQSLQLLLLQLPHNICQLYIPLTQPINRFLSPVVSYMSPIYKKAILLLQKQYENVPVIVAD